MAYYYSVYHLKIKSELPLSHIAICNTESSDYEVTICFDKVDAQGLENPLQTGLCYQATSTLFWLNVPSVARFLVANGHKIIIDPRPDVDDASILAFLFNTCFEILLRQRQLLIMNGYALQFGPYAISFIGRPTAGHSLLLGTFFKRGYTVFATNFLALNKQIEILPGIARLELWPHITSYLGFNTQALKTMRPGVDKFIIPLEKQFYLKPLPLTLQYILKSCEQPDISFANMDAAKKMQCLIHNVNQRNTLSCLGNANYNVQQCNKIANKVEMICISLPKTKFKLENLADAIENDLYERGHCHAST